MDGSANPENRRCLILYPLPSRYQQRRGREPKAIRVMFNVFADFRQQAGMVLIEALVHDCKDFLGSAISTAARYLRQ
jgi:hypothetical protein